MQVYTSISGHDDIQSNFNDSNTFGAMKTCSRQGLFELMSVNLCARSVDKIGISFRFSSILGNIMCSHENRLMEAILMSTHNIPFSI